MHKYNLCLNNNLFIYCINYMFHNCVGQYKSLFLIIMSNQLHKNFISTKTS